jgi:serine/threonine protein kinase
VPGEGAGIRFGQYVLLRRLARGGMAEVFLAQQHGFEGFDRRVAVKRILPHLADAPDFIQMFLGEAKLAAQLTHPNIVHIYDFGKVERDYFIAMEYVAGVHAGDLFKHGDDADRLSPTMIARIGADAAAALHYAHELRTPGGKRAGLVHRDVSPANLMISFDGVVKLCDFGIAKAAAISDRLTKPGTVKGKYGYMSPEQTVGAPLDGRSDVYALAIVLWELLSRKTIVPRGEAVEAMRAIRDGKLMPIEQAAPWTPAPLAAAITWALQRKRDQRPTAMQLAQALEAFIKSSPEVATAMALGAWLRDRFPRETTGETDTVPEGTEAVLGTLATPPSSLSAAIPRGSLPVPQSTDTTGETIALPPPNRAVPVLVAARGPAGDPAGDPAADSAGDEATLLAPPPPELAALDAPEPAAMRIAGAQAPTMIAGPAQAVTLLAGPAHAPTLLAGATLAATVVGLAGRGGPSSAGASTLRLDPSQQPDPRGVGDRRVEAAIARPWSGAPGASTAWVPPPRARLALAIGGLVALALVSFLIALAARGKSPPARDPAAAAIALDATPADVRPVPIDAAPSPPIPIDADPMATLEIRTRPDGATLKVDGHAHPAPAEVSLAPGRYFIDAELDGWMPERRAVELARGERVVQEIVFTLRLTHRDRGAQFGRLIARTTPPSEVFLGTRRWTETPFDKELDPGTYTLVFKHPRHENLIKRVTIAAGKTTRLTLALP